MPGGDRPIGPVKKPEMVFVEEISITSWGTFSRFALGIGLVIETIALLGSSNILQQIQAGVAFIGTAIVAPSELPWVEKRTYGSTGPQRIPKADAPSFLEIACLAEMIGQRRQ
jgi:hypothetical protein